MVVYAQPTSYALGIESFHSDLNLRRSLRRRDFKTFFRTKSLNETGTSSSTDQSDPSLIGY